MKKEITTITAAEAATTENIEKQEEKIMKREIKLEKFTDEDMIRYEWELNALYQGREHFIRDFQELYINGNCQIEEIKNAIPMMIDYINDFATSARVWNNILETSKYKSFYAKKSEYDNKEMNENIKTRILNSYRPTENDAEQVVYRIYATIAVAVYNATFAPDGQYRVVRMAYRDYKKKFIVSPDRYEYTCVNTLKCMAVYVKTGEYDPETKTIEVYIPANWDGDDARWWCARKAGDLPEIAAEMAKENKVQEEEDMKEKEELEEKKQEIISSVESWYEGCYDAIYDLTKSVKNTNRYSRNRDTAEARKLEQYWKLMGYSRGGGDEREADFDTIRNSIIGYLREQPLEYFEDIEDQLNEDSMLDIINDAYNYADFELPERPDRKEEWLEFVRTCPADWFDYADDPETERDNLIDMYEDWDGVVFCDFDYAASGEYSDPYTTMRDDA